MKRNRNVIYGEHNFKSNKVQQIIQHYPIVKGLHYSTDIDFLYSNMVMYLVLKERLESGEHISLFSRVIEDVEDFTKHLSSKYKKDYDRNFITIINLTFSEN